MIVKRGDVYFADLSPVVGSEQGGVRPVLVIQNDIGNRYSNITIVAAITSTFQVPVHRTNVVVRAPEGGLSVDSAVRLDQIRSVDKRRLLKRLGGIRPTTLTKVDQAIKISLGLVNLA